MLRVFQFKPGVDPKDWLRKSFGGTAGAAVALERVKALNPHVDFEHLEAGTVLLLPETPGATADEDGRSIGGEAFDAFIRQADDGFQAAGRRMVSAADDLEAEHKAVAEALDTEVVKRLIDTDPLLKQQLDEARDAWNADLRNARKAVDQLQAMWESASREFEVLRRLLG